MNRQRIYASFMLDDLSDQSLEYAPSRKGFGEGLLMAGESNRDIVALSADLTESTQMGAFKKAYPERFIEIGVAEQNLVTVAAGLAAIGKIPFATSYAAFSPGRNWEQIRTTVCLNDQPVKIVGSHAGLSVGADGATHQMLEDIALMRSLPNMTVIVPCDAQEAKRATIALVKSKKPAYLRLAREKSAIVTKPDAPFEIGRSYVMRFGTDVTILSTGILVHEVIKAAVELAQKNISAEIINVATVKPLDEKTILESAKKTKAIVSVEEGQIAGGMGSAVAELLTAKLPLPLERVGVLDRFGQSGQPQQLWDEYNLSSPSIVAAALKVIKRK